MLVAQRAARALGELFMVANLMDIEQAAAFGENQPIVLLARDELARRRRDAAVPPPGGPAED